MRSELQIDDRPLATRMTAFRAALLDVRTLADAQALFLEPDLDVLREIEREFNFHPRPTSGLRDHLAREYMRRRKGEQAQDTTRITETVFRGFVANVISEWLPGITDFDPDLGGQYQITVQNDGSFRVATPDGYDPKHFRILLAVNEVMDE